MIGTFCQFGEERIIGPALADIAAGMVVDVGAGDGIKQSQSRGLILDGWHAILIDPLPHHAQTLCDLYEEEPRVRVVRCAIGETEATAAFHPCLTNSFDSTLSGDWQAYCIGNGDKYAEPIIVEVRRLEDVLDDCGCCRVDFLTIDAEATDLAVLRSNDWTRWRPRLVCAEWTAGPNGAIPDFMASVGYRWLDSTKGNAFWVSIR